MCEIEIINTLRNAFTDDNIKRQVLEPCWYQFNITWGIHSTGFCFAASEVLYRLTGENQIWMVKRLIDPTNWNNGTHYFLMRRKDNQIIDLTSDQYTERGIEIPYQHGRGCGLRNVSNKARLLARLSGLGEL